ncbi:MAG: RNA methyltransferase [Bdellovibrionaceae bacterium]|nr:RNA methyltransferase [Pseudobdellovibrionaceae bacterium]
MSLPLRTQLNEDIALSSDLRVSPDLVIDLIGPLLTPERRMKIDRVVSGRTANVAVVLDGLYDKGNISAVMRTAEAFGFVNFHVIETQEKFKEANRVAQGADKWIEVQKWKKPSDCISAIKSQGFQLVVTSLDASRPLNEIDFSRPTAFVLGNEKSGVSSEMLAAADERVIIPMSGFVQSFNISVAGALGLYHIHLAREKTFGNSGDLSPTERNNLIAQYYLRTQDSAADILSEWISRKSKA